MVHQYHHCKNFGGGVLKIQEWGVGNLLNYVSYIKHVGKIASFWGSHSWHMYTWKESKSLDTNKAMGLSRMASS